jgi:hypothetical protein
MQERHPRNFWSVLSMPPLFFLVGLMLTSREAATRKSEREKCSLILIWFFLPLILLSLREVKFPRYLFIWSMPLCALFMAIAVQRIRGLGISRRASAFVEITLLLLIVLSPQLTTTSRPGSQAYSGRSGLLTYLEHGIARVPNDNWERMRWQAEQLNARTDPEDIIVTSLDDASLQYYLGRFVYGFLNSKRTDEFFLRLLEQAEQRGVKLWLIDTLPHANYCLTGEPEPRHIDCRIKYRRFYQNRRFYQKCAGADDRVSPACIRLPVYGPR